MKLKTSLILLCVMFVASSGPVFSLGLLEKNWSEGCLLDDVATQAELSTCCNRKLRLCRDEKIGAGVRIQRAHSAKCKAKHRQCLKLKGRVNNFGKKEKGPQKYAPDTGSTNSSKRPDTGSTNSSKRRKVNRKRLEKK